MATNYVLIDFENVHPKNLDILAGHAFKVFVFVGANQTKVPIDLAAALQKLGSEARYIRIAGSGRNALDFHIACYLGELAAKDPQGYFHVVSRDKGFDPLIRHLKGRNIRIQREHDVAEIPLLRISDAASNEDKISAIVKNLKGRGQSRPRKVKTLANTINALFKRELGEAELMSLIKALQKQKYIKVSQDKVTYQLGN